MIRINLLPFRAARSKESVRRQISIFLLSLIFIALCLVGIHYYFKGEVDDWSNKIVSIKKELADYKKINKEIAEIKKKLAIVEKKMQVIKNLELNRKEPVRLLETFQDLLVEKEVKNRLWFTNLTTNNNTNQVAITGIALDNRTTADFMTLLEGSGLFSSVNLKAIKHYAYKESNLNLKSFEVACSKVMLEKPNMNPNKKGLKPGTLNKAK